MKPVAFQGVFLRAHHGEGESPLHAGFEPGNPSQESLASRDLRIIDAAVGGQILRVRDLPAQGVSHVEIVDPYVFEGFFDGFLVELLGLTTVRNPSYIHDRVDTVFPDPLKEIFQGIVRMPDGIKLHGLGS